MNARSISFRTTLYGEIHDFLARSGFDCCETARCVVQLASMLSNYQEEGTPLSPKVFISKDARELFRYFGPTDYVPIGEGPLHEGTMTAALKSCAPLADGDWHIHCELSSDKIKYGVFIATSDPIGITPKEVFYVGMTDPIAIMVEQTSNGIIDITSNKNTSIKFFFSAQDPILTNDDEPLRKLVKDIFKNSNSDGIEVFHNYLLRTISSALHISHGSIIAVLSDLTDKGKIFQDVIWLEEKIDIHEQIKNYRSERSIQSLHKIQAITILLKRMICSDGVIVFGDNATIVGFRAFIKNDTSTGEKIAGGARSRAYHELKKNVGDTLSGVLFCSQDGLIKYHGVDNKNE